MGIDNRVRLPYYVLHYVFGWLVEEGDVQLRRRLVREARILRSVEIVLFDRARTKGLIGKEIVDYVNDRRGLEGVEGRVLALLYLENMVLGLVGIIAGIEALVLLIVPVDRVIPIILLRLHTLIGLQRGWSELGLFRFLGGL